MSENSQSPPQWADYYRAVSQRPARELYRQTVARFEPTTASSRLAIDLGCGPGIEALDLLSRGWRVLAIDKETAAIEQLITRVPPEYHDRLVTKVATFESVELPAADFVWAGLSLPFCPTDTFPAVWAKILAALRPGGRFAGDFFGDRSERRGGWISESGMTFLTRPQVMDLVRPLHLEYFIEEEGERLMALSGLQHVHAFGVMARQR